MDDPGRCPLFQLLKGHIEVPEGLQVGELQYHGRIQEPGLDGQHVEQATKAPAVLALSSASGPSQHQR